VRCTRQVCNVGQVSKSSVAVDPTWASANLGVFLCLNCSGCHRSIGVHITQVRSITMDAWFPDQIEVRCHSSRAARNSCAHSRVTVCGGGQTMKKWGNARARAVWEGNVPGGMEVPDENSSRAQMDVWIRDKYVNKKYFKAVRPDQIIPVVLPRQHAQKVRQPRQPAICTRDASLT
jgi:stromal membrane-associated protein